MNSNLSDALALTNDVLQSVIVIFGAAVVLYNSGRSLRAPVLRAFNVLISLFVIVYLTELLVSRIIVSLSAETWLRIEWIGIALVPAAQYHLSDSLLTTTGAPPRRRRLIVPAGYLIGLVFLSLVFATELIVAELVGQPHTPYLRAGSLFPLFTAYFWLFSAASIFNVWRARQRSMTARSGSACPSP